MKLRIHHPLAALVLAAALCACERSQPYEDAAYDETRTRWQDELAAHGEVGLEASFALSGDPIFVTGASEATLASSRAVPKNTSPYVYLPNATVEGAGTGTLVVEAEALAIGGEVSLSVIGVDITAEGVRLEVETRRPSGEAPALPEGWEGAAAAWQSEADLRAPSVALDGFARAVLLTDEGATELTPPLTVEAATLVWDGAGRVEAEDALELDYGRFALGGEVTSGSLTLSNGPAVDEPPSGVFGHSATLAISPGGVSSVGTFRLTQAAVSDGDDDLLLESEVELFGPTETVPLARGEKSLIPVLYREKSYRGDAVLDTLEVEGSGAEHIELNVDWPDALLFNLVERIDASVEGLAVAVLVTVAAPALFVLTAVECVFEGCPVPDALPLWIYAGTVSSFEVLVKDTTPAGEYDLTIRVIGKNYDPVTVSLAFVVE